MNRMKLSPYRREVDRFLRNSASKTNTVYTRIWRSIAVMVVVVFLIAGIAITVYVNSTITRQITAQ